MKYPEFIQRERAGSAKGRGHNLHNSQISQGIIILEKLLSVNVMVID